MEEVSTTASSIATNFGVALTTGSDTILNDLVSFVSGFAAVGLLAMAIWESLKILLSIRAMYFKERIPLHVKPASWGKTEKLIIKYTTGSAESFYKQELDEIITGLSAVVNIVLTDPLHDAHKRFLENWVEEVDLAKVEEYLKLTEEIEQPANGDALDDDVKKEKVKQAERQKTRLKTILDANTRGLKASFSESWGRTQRYIIMGISFCLVFSILDYDRILDTLILSALGGVFAPYAHDVLNKLKAAKVK
jgi:hypothetical protein